MSASLRNVLSGNSANAICARTRSSSSFAAIPARVSPERAGLALAIKSLRLRNRCVRPPTVREYAVIAVFPLPRLLSPTASVPYGHGGSIVEQDLGGTMSIRNALVSLAWFQPLRSSPPRE